MVLNRLCDPDSKLGVLRWLETVSPPGAMDESIEHQHLLRSMDAIVEHKEAVEQVFTNLLRPLVDQDLAVVFYDMTTIRAEGLSQQDGDVRHFGMAKEGLITRQVMLGVVQTAEGLPLYHEIFDGNTAEVTTIKPIIEKIVQTSKRLCRPFTLIKIKDLDENRRYHLLNSRYRSRQFLSLVRRGTRAGPRRSPPNCRRAHCDPPSEHQPR